MQPILPDTILYQIFGWAISTFLDEAIAGNLKYSPSTAGRANEADVSHTIPHDYNDPSQNPILSLQLVSKPTTTYVTLPILSEVLDIPLCVDSAGVQR